MSNNLKPIIKWVGGKTQIIDKLFEYFPKTINNYYEPFIGGGSVFLKLIEKLENNEIKLNGNINLSDKNINLIILYNTIKNNHIDLINKLKELKNNYQIAKDIKYKSRTKFIITDKNENDTDKKIYINKNESIEQIISKGKKCLYYYYRYIFNTTKNNILLSSLFIFLNKTCFRGIYRIGPKGFNVPYGNYNNVSIFNENYIIKLSNLFNKYNIIFESKSFELIKIDNISNNDFFYFDPPYYPIDKKSFVGYQKEGFDIKLNKELINFCNSLNLKKIKFVHSNSYTDFILNSYNNFNIDKINCKRTINSKKPNSKVNEVIIYN